MSTKIYDAVRFPIGRLRDFLDWSRIGMVGVVKERIEALMMAVDPAKLGECPEHFRGGGETIWERHKRMTVVMADCRSAAKSSMRDPVFDIECGFNLWPYEGFFYAIPIAERWIIHSLDNRPAWVQEYEYQNSTDWPEEVSAEDWEERRVTWENVCLNSHNARRLFFQIVACKTELDSHELEWELSTEAVWKWQDQRPESEGGG